MGTQLVLLDNHLLAFKPYLGIEPDPPTVRHCFQDPVPRPSIRPQLLAGPPHVELRRQNRDTRIDSWDEFGQMLRHLRGRVRCEMRAAPAPWRLAKRCSTESSRSGSACHRRADCYRTITRNEAATELTGRTNDKSCAPSASPAKNSAIPRPRVARETSWCRVSREPRPNLLSPRR